MMDAHRDRIVELPGPGGRVRLKATDSAEVADGEFREVPAGTLATVKANGDSWFMVEFDDGSVR
jgi:hypothetical protein